MSFESDLCKIFYHDWVKKDEWTHCSRCSKKWNFPEDWKEFCFRGDRRMQGSLLLEGCKQRQSPSGKTL